MLFLLRTVILQEFAAVRILDMRAAIWRESWEAHLLIPGSKMELLNIRMSSKVATEKPSTNKNVPELGERKNTLRSGFG